MTVIFAIESMLVCFFRAYRIRFYIYLLNKIELSYLKYFVSINIPFLHYRLRELEKLVDFIFLIENIQFPIPLKKKQKYF